MRYVSGALVGAVLTLSLAGNAADPPRCANRLDLDGVNAKLDRLSADSAGLARTDIEIKEHLKSLNSTLANIDRTLEHMYVEMPRR
jgi:hypothetical protein